MPRHRYTYTSAAKAQVESFVRARSAVGAACDTYLRYLHEFDSYVARRFPLESEITQEMLDGWFEPRPNESPKSCHTRCEPVAALVRFLRERGETDAEVPALPRLTKSGYCPHSFTHRELSEFFGLCDSWEPPSNMPTDRALRTRYTLPVLFRLLWSSGMRTTEARLLRRACVDLAVGSVLIREGKGRSERLVALHPSMAELMRTYDDRMQEVMPDRVYFFPNGTTTCLSSRWLSEHFRRMWTRVSDERAVAYELRHCYCTTAIDRLVRGGVDGLRDLEWVSKAMGHSSVDVTTHYYYHIVPSLAGLLQQRSEGGFDDLTPDVGRASSNPVPGEGVD